MLWKGIVNPLRKSVYLSVYIAPSVYHTFSDLRNGVVRYESVMRLRDKLEELAKMKGVHANERGVLVRKSKGKGGKGLHNS